MPKPNPEQILTYDGPFTLHSRRLGDVSDAGLTYLVQYGFTQSLQDSIAGLAKGTREMLGDAPATLTGEALAKFHATAQANRVKWARELNLPVDSDADTFVEHLTERKLRERANAIVAGEMVAPKGRGPKRTGLEAEIWTVATETAVAIAKKKNLALPKNAEARDAHIQALIDSAKHGPAIVEEATAKMARIARLAALGDDDSDGPAAQDESAPAPAQDETQATNGAAPPADLPLTPKAKGKGKAA